MKVGRMDVAMWWSRRLTVNGQVVPISYACTAHDAVQLFKKAAEDEGVSYDRY